MLRLVRRRVPHIRASHKRLRFSPWILQESWSSLTPPPLKGGGLFREKSKKVPRPSAMSRLGKDTSLCSLLIRRRLRAPSQLWARRGLDDGCTLAYTVHHDSTTTSVRCQEILAKKLLFMLNSSLDQASYPSRHRAGGHIPNQWLGSICPPPPHEGGAGAPLRRATKCAFCAVNHAKRGILYGWVCVHSALVSAPC